MSQVLEFFGKLFGTESWPARWFCGIWTDFHGWFYIVSDLAIWAAYFTIPLILFYFVRQRENIPFRGIFLLFGIFILACGTTHLLDALMFWWPAYRLNALMRFFTAIASWSTLWALTKVVPYALDLKSPKDLEETIVKRTAELQESQEKLAAANMELVQKNHELLRINNDLDQFVYTASHDLKAPIANLEGLSLQLRESQSYALPEPDSVLLDLMGNSISKLKLAILDLTEISKVQKELASNKEELSFTGVLDDVLADMSGLLAESKASIETDFQVETVAFARKNLRSIFYNLISNALKYRSPDRPPVVKINTFTEGDFVVLQVQDNGMGIPKNQLPRVFTMFTRFHSHVEGTGIGLYIIKRIIENHYGRVEVQSEEDNGTTFRIWFPGGMLNSVAAEDNLQLTY